MSFFKELKRRNVFRVGIAYTVATWLLIQVTDTVFPRIGLPDSAVTLVIALLAIGFIPALIFAWAFEMTPDGIKREKDVDRSQSIAPTTGRKLDRVIIGVLTVLVAYLLIDKLVLSEPTTTQARLPELMVTARTSSFHFKDKNMPIPEIATILGVNHIVEGSVRRSGERVMKKAHSISEPIDLLPEANRFFDQALALVPSITNAQMERTDLYGHIIYDNAIGHSNFTPAELEAALQEILAGLTQAARYAQLDGQRAYIEAERAEFSGDWSSIPSKLDRAFQSEECYAVNWVSSVAGIFGWAGQTDKVIALTNHFLDNVAFHPWVDDVRFLALLSSGKYSDTPGVYEPNPPGSIYPVPRKLFAYALDNEVDRAREIFESAKESTQIDDMTMLYVQAALGNGTQLTASPAKWMPDLKTVDTTLRGINELFC